MVSSLLFCLFFFKQKTAYEMRISDGSSDVCSSDLAKVADLARNGPIIIVGWSLGGLYAREIAKRRPHDVARVVTLGSPFSGDIRANRAWRLYEWIAGHKVDHLPPGMRLAEKPPQPPFALWPHHDGIVSPAPQTGT